MTRGLAFKASRCKVNLTGWNKQVDHRLTLTLGATGLKSRRLHGQATDVEFTGFFHPLSQSGKSRL